MRVNGKYESTITRKRDKHVEFWWGEVGKNRFC